MVPFLASLDFLCLHYSPAGFGRQAYEASCLPHSQLQGPKAICAQVVWPGIDGFRSVEKCGFSPGSKHLNGFLQPGLAQYFHPTRSPDAVLAKAGFLATYPGLPNGQQ